MSNEDLLDELCFAYEDMRDYVNRSRWDHRWSQEAEDEATEKYNKLCQEVLKRMTSANESTP